MPELIFIGTSGRSGSYGLTQALNLIPEVEAHHQYACVDVQRIGTLLFRGRVTPFAAMAALDRIYGPILAHSKAHWVVDVSNKLPWVMRLLVQMYNPTMAYVVRDGQNVCLSYYHKLPEVYAHVGPLAKFFSHETLYPPPPEERYWWPYPQTVPMRRWDLLCWHWWASYHQACGGNVFKFEELVGGKFGYFLTALGLPKSDEAERFLTSKPHNVIEPRNYEMDAEQAAVFEAICGDLYRTLGYKGKYDVRYMQPV